MREGVCVCACASCSVVQWNYRPIIVGSSTIPSSSEAAWDPFRFLEYIRNVMASNKCKRNTNL